MSPVTLVLIALGVSADAFAVALGKGLQLRRGRWRTGIEIALAFGVAQAVMPLIGYLLASRLRGTVTAVDHWIAFGLLTALGLRMIWGALADRREAAADPDPVSRGSDAESPRTSGSSARAGGTLTATVGEATTDRIAPVELLVLAVATSIDALAVGISLAFLDVHILTTVLVIGVTTTALSLLGVHLGRRLGARAGTPAEVVGGLVLIAIGVKVLVDHLHLL